MASDLEGLVEMEKAVWGEGVGIESMASPEVIRNRIALCNASPPGWFWVAEARGKIVAALVLQPTKMSPDECTGWAMATDNGSLVHTFDPEGDFLYGASMSALFDAPPGASDLLVLAGHSLRMFSGKHLVYACARMPGFLQEHEATGIAPEDYWCLKRKNGAPKDPFLWHFETMIGFRPVRLLRDGYPPDKDSGGHGVLCVSEDPMGDIAASIQRIRNIRKE
jgi:hypothetical protein